MKKFLVLVCSAALAVPIPAISPTFFNFYPLHLAPRHVPIVPANAKPKAASPFVKRAGAKPGQVASFHITFPEIRGKRKVRVAIAEQIKNPEMPLFAPLASAFPKASEMQSKLEAALRKIFLNPQIADEEWKRRELIKTIVVYSGLDKMADFSAGEIQLDEDLFGNEGKGIPFDEGLLVLELELKLDHLAAIRDRRGVPAKPAQLALEKLRFLRLYIQRFLEQEPQTQEAQIEMLRSHIQELDQGRFHEILAKARILRQQLGERQPLTLLDTVTMENLIPYLRDHYPEILARGLRMLEGEHVPILAELRHPSEFLNWNTPSRGTETLRLSFADIDDVWRFYQDKDEKTRAAWVTRVEAVMQIQFNHQSKILVKVAERNGEVLAWAAVTCMRGAVPIFRDEEKGTVNRLVVTDFDVKQTKEGLDRSLTPLLLSVARLIPIWTTSIYIQMSLAPDQLAVQSKIPFQEIISPGQFPAEDYLDDDEEISGRERELPKEIFVDALQLVTRYGPHFQNSAREVNFFEMLREIWGDLARFKEARGWIYEDRQEDKWKHQFGGRCPSEKAIPLLNWGGADPEQRQRELLRILSEAAPMALILSSSKVWIVEKQVFDLVQLPLVEEMGLDRAFGQLRNLFERFSVYDSQNWEEARSLLGLQFLAEALSKLAFDQAANEEKYFILLSWLTGTRIRMINTQARPEWVEEEILSHRAEELPERERLPFAKILLEKFNASVLQLTRETCDVKSRGTDLAKALEDLMARLQRFRSSNRDLPRVLKDLESMRNWAANLDPRYKNMPRSLSENLTETLKPIGELSSGENDALRNVLGTLQRVKWAHDFVMSEKAQKEISGLAERVLKKIQTLERKISEPGPQDFIGLDPEQENLLEQAV